MTAVERDPEPYYRRLETRVRTALMMWRSRFAGMPLPGGDWLHQIAPDAEVLVSERTWRQYETSVMMDVCADAQGVNDYLYTKATDAEPNVPMIGGNRTRIVRNMPDDTVWLAVRP